MVPNNIGIMRGFALWFPTKSGLNLEKYASNLR